MTAPRAQSLKGNSIIFAGTLHLTIINAFESESHKVPALPKVHPLDFPCTYLAFLILFAREKDYFRSLSWPWHDLYAAILSAMRTSGICEFLLTKWSFEYCRNTKPASDSPIRRHTINLALWSHKLCVCTKSILFKICINWTLKPLPPPPSPPHKYIPAANAGCMHFLNTYIYPVTEHECETWYAKHRWA